MPWTWLVSNVLTMGAFTLIFAALLGPPIGAATSLVSYFGIAIADNLEFRETPWLPLVPYPGPEGNWALAVIAVVVAMGVHAWTLGTTSWAHRLGRND